MQKKSRLTSSLTPEDPGYLLINMIIDKIAKLSLKTSDASSRMDMPSTYFSKIRKKEVRTDRMPSEYYNGIAKFLGQSPVAIRMLSGQIKPQDFYRPIMDAAQEVDRCIDFISSDPDWMPFCPSSINECDQEVKLFIIELYENAKGLSILKNKVNYQEIIDHVDIHKTKDV